MVKLVDTLALGARQNGLSACALSLWTQKLQLFVILPLKFGEYGDVVELVDTLALGASGATREGSSPFVPTKFLKKNKKAWRFKSSSAHHAKARPFDSSLA